ncbi:SDR family oxidoreductase [Ostreiculturibacter nitratireducens]|uniref:SDR family oxidoreductase n=1 Tax=Ostreiculturibacter nitratireducens TaxID=3075226 RepID=UPI0031B59A44
MEFRVGGVPRGLRVFISGGAAGIGRTIADMLVAHGARVHVTDVSDEALADFTSAHPDHAASKADVSDEGRMEQVFRRIGADWGGLDALVNNAGIAGPTGGVEEISVEDWRRCIDVGLTGQFICAHFAVPMIKQAGGGAIVNMSSAAGRFGYAFRTPYSSAKWGVIGLTQSLAKELGPDNIRVNAILPGIIEGPRMENVIAARARQVGVSHDEMKKTYLERVSMRRMTPQADIAAMATFLLSDMGRNLSGQSFGVDGNVEAL